MAKDDYGPAIKNGRLLRTSATGITRADPNSVGGCLRRWYFEVCEGRKTPETEAMRVGTVLHSHIEGYFNGNPLLMQTVIAGKQFIPAPGPGVLSESSLGSVGKSILEVDGVSIVGRIDLLNFRGTYRDSEGDEQTESHPNTFEVLDWKTTSDFRWAKSAKDLANNMQLLVYAEAGFAQRPELTHARLTHVYFRTRGRPEAKLVTTLQDREHVRRGWEYAKSIVRTIVDVARETSADKVDGNAASCDAFRGCPHRLYCSVAKPNDSLEDIFGPRGASSLLSRLGDSVSLLPSPGVNAEIARLQAEENARRNALPAGFAEAIATIEASGRGSPGYSGRAAQFVAQAGSQAIAPGTSFASSGWLGTVIKTALEDPEDVIRLAGEIAGLPSLTPPAAITPPPAPEPFVQLTLPIDPVPPPALLAPDAPESKPALAALPVEGLTTPKSLELNALLDGPPNVWTVHETMEAVNSLSGPLPKPDAVWTMQESAGSLADSVGTVSLPTESKKRGRPAKAAPTKEIASTPTPIVVTQAEAKTPRFEIYVNAIPNSPFDRLETYVQIACSVICEQYDAVDIRCAPKDGPLGYDKWKGALAAFVRARPPAPGTYVVFTAGNDLAAIVAASLRSVVTDAGGLFVEGI